jgi:uncharacterized protein (TIGR00730 family)
MEDVPISNSICVYCGSSPGTLAQYTEEARAFGACLARERITLVYGGGRVGLMGAVADGALTAGGHVIGVIPSALVAKEVAHRGLSELRIVDSMHERKKVMAELADGFVALPGGVGTLEEIVEMITWGQLGLHAKPCAFLNVAGFYDHLIRFLQGMVDHRFLMREHHSGLIFANDRETLLTKLREFAPIQVDRWSDPKNSP